MATAASEGTGDTDPAIEDLLAPLLLIDDDPVFRILVSKTLTHAGFSVDVSPDGEDAVERFAATRYALVLLDLVLPGADGYAVCRRLRAMQGRQRIPILVLTGLNDSAAIAQAYRSGATDFITKPINWTLLAHRVRYALRNSAAMEDIRRGRERLSRALLQARMGNWTVHADGTTEFSLELLRLFGVAPSDSPPRVLEDLMPRVMPADRAVLRLARARLQRAGTPYQLEYRIGEPAGLARTVLESAEVVVDDQGANGIEGITQDITERVQARDRIHRLAHFDATTGLPNREFLGASVSPMLVRSGMRCAMLHIDLDRFSHVNDVYGRAFGDLVLQTVALRLRDCLVSRAAGMSARGRAETGAPVPIARIGPNAFAAVVIDLVGATDATLLAQRLTAVIAQPIAVPVRSAQEAEPLVLTASMGISFFPGDASDLPTLARCAEQAVRAAKSIGRSTLRFFSEDMNVRAASRLLFEQDLRRGIQRDELQLYYQPKVDARTSVICGAEALVRWQHPDKGLLGPGSFIPSAEENTLIGPLTHWVLHAACRQLCHWRNAGLDTLSVSVNLSASSLSDSGLAAGLDQLRAQYGLPAGALVLEITESMLAPDLDAVILLLDELRDRGYRLSLDDFGTGYSSLSFLQRLPLDELKIDRSFVTHAPTSVKDAALVTAIIALGQALGLAVVAEGVETSEQSAFLLARGCHVHQGYFFSRPLPAEQFEQLLRAGPADGRAAGSG